jgi:hypothetical protein
LPPAFPIGLGPTSKDSLFSLAEICRQPFLLVSGERFGNSQSQKLQVSAGQRFSASLSYWSQIKDSAPVNLKSCMVQLGRDLAPAFPVVFKEKIRQRPISKATWFSLAEICLKKKES